MKIQRDWGRNFMENFSYGGAKKDTELEEKLTPATEISGRPVESPKKLVNIAPTRCSSHQARHGTVDSSNLSKELYEKRQEEWDTEITDDHSVNQQESGAKLDITMIVQSMKRGNRSTRQRRDSSVPWVEPLGFNFRNVERARQNDQVVGSKKMKRTCRGTKSCVNNREAKRKKSVGGGSDASNQSSPANLDKGQDSAVDANAVEHLSVPNSNTSPKSKEQFGTDADKHSSKQSSGPVPADDLNNNWTYFKKSKDAVADGLMTTTDVINLYEVKENHTKFDPAIIPGLDLEDGAESFDTSTTQSALASLPIVSVPDPCIEFAVKILKDEMPLTAYVPEVDEIIREMMCHSKSTIAGTPKSAQDRKH